MYTIVGVCVRVCVSSASGQWEGVCQRLSYRGRGEQSVGVYVTVHVGVRVRVRGGGSAIPMTPPLPPNALYYHASIFVEFENVRHYHMYSNTRSIVYSKESSTIEASLECIQSNVTIHNTSCLFRCILVIRR